MTDTHITTPTRFVEVGGSRFAYRRWGHNASSQPHCFCCSTSGAAWTIGIR